VRTINSRNRYFPSQKCNHGFRPEGEESSSSGREKRVPDYLENNVVRFVYLLRSEGIRIGNSEVIDALQALQLVPLGERDKVKTALKATLIKKASDYGVFERVFAFFFTPPETREAFRELRQQKMAQYDRQIRGGAGFYFSRREDGSFRNGEDGICLYAPKGKKTSPGIPGDE
jgi:hypothetical protein